MKQALEEMIKGTKQQRMFLAEHSFLCFALYYFRDFFQYSLAPFHYDFAQDAEDLQNGKYREVVWLGFRECAKRQPLDADILTPSGFRKLGDLSVGDYVITESGKKTKIVFMSDVVQRDIYTLKTEDGRSAECDIEHLWKVRRMSNTKEKHVVLTAEEIIKKGIKYNRKPDRRTGKVYPEYKFAIDTPSPVEFAEKKLTIDPYFLGLWLGDGSKDSSNITNIEPEIEEFLKEYAKEVGLFFRARINKDRTQTLIISSQRTGGKRQFTITGELNKKGLLNNKHIPNVYLHGSIEQRKALLEGLMDTDGTVSNGTMSFTNKNEKIIDGLVWLVRSLGGKAVKRENNTTCVYKGVRKYCSAWRVSVFFGDYIPFRVERKRKKARPTNRMFSRIVSIEMSGNKQGRCIKVEDDSEMYITNDFLLTHNTTIAKLYLIWLIAHKKRKYINVDSFDRENAERILFDIAFELTQNRMLKHDYGELLTKRREMDDIKQNRINNFVTENGIRVEAHSTGESVRGRIHREQRPDFLLLDDFETTKTSTSQAHTRQVRGHIEEFQTGLAPNAGILYLGNYITKFGTIQTLIDRSKEDKRLLVRNIPILQDGKPTWDAKYALTDEGAEKEGKVSLEDKKRQLTTRQWSAEMMNNPIDYETQIFHEEDMVFITPDWSNYVSIYASVDPSLGKSTTSDYSAIIFLGKHKDGFLDVLIADIQRRHPDKIIDDVLTNSSTITYHCGSEAIGEIAVESVAFQDFFRTQLQDASVKRGFYLPIVPMENTTTKKELRIQTLQPLVKSGTIRFQRQHKILIEQLLSFPIGTHDDGPDALEMAVRRAKKPHIMTKSV